MCVDDKELSAYIDGELTEERAADVTAHLSVCNSCTVRVERLFRTARLIRSVQRDGTELSRRMERSRQRISVAVERKREPLFWGRRVLVPVPLAAAMFFLLFAAVTILFTGNGDFGPRTYDGAIPVVEKADAREEVSFGSRAGEPSREELEELFRFLSEQGASVEVKIELPKPSSFTVYGEPQLIRAADFIDTRETAPN
jgi:hypothetical protein